MIEQLSIAHNRIHAIQILGRGMRSPGNMFLVVIPSLEAEDIVGPIFLVIPS